MLASRMPYWKPQVPYITPQNWVNFWESNKLIIRLCWSTDGGPDHNNTFLSVKLGLIALFLRHDLDMIEAVRTAPYHSWKNPCERVNCILNLGLQAVGLMRTWMEEKFESAIVKLQLDQSSMWSSENHCRSKRSTQDSMEPPKALIHSIFSRLSLKDKPIMGYSAATEHEMEAFLVFCRMLSLTSPKRTGQRSASIRALN